MSAESAKFIFEHVFLPPKLPQTHHNESGAQELLEEMWRSALLIARSFPPTSSKWRMWGRLSESIKTWIELQGQPCNTAITNSLKALGEDDVLLFYVESQNATIVVRKKQTGAIFECFEVLAKAEAVLEAKDALLRHFPARAVYVPEEKLGDSPFIEELGNAIHKLFLEQLRIAMHTTKKAGNEVVEERQSAHPRLVTEWLFGLLRTCGEAHSSTVIRKRVHDDVCWKDTDLPWRRSGLWLSARAALQITLMNTELEGEGESHYKNFMLLLLSRLARKVLKTTLEPDVLHVLQVKLARRNAKLGSDTFDFVQKIVSKTLADIDKHMQDQWKDVIQRDQLSVKSIPTDQLSDELLLSQSRAVLRGIWARSRKSFIKTSTTYAPPTVVRVNFRTESLPSPLMFETNSDLLFCLIDFEMWIEEHLRSWTAANSTRPAACGALLKLIEKYYAIAKTKYQGHPEKTSNMLLVIFELWMAIDTIATTIHPLLLDYPHDIPLNLFSPLLLSKKAELERLSDVERHLNLRNSSLAVSNPSLLTDPCPQSFAVKFYDESMQLQELRRKVEEECLQERYAKSEEWKIKRQQYDTLIEQAGRMTCGTFIPRGVDRNGNPFVGEPQHHNKCKKCAIGTAARQISISKYEWALPANETFCKAVIFELGAPECIVAWRDATVFVLQDVGNHCVKKGAASLQNLLDYAPLAKHARHRERRVTLCSSVKSVAKSHYLTSSVNMDPIFVKNGLRPRMYDKSDFQVWTAEQNFNPSLIDHCKVTLPTVVDERLGPYINSTTHTANSVVARQSTFLPAMGPHETVLFGSLRSGERLQMLNLLGALLSPIIDLNSSTTATLFRYAARQVGTAGSGPIRFLRESQTVIEDDCFSQSMMTALETAFLKIEANFKEISTAALLLRLFLQFLSLTPFPKIAVRCMNMVLQIRGAAVCWIRQISKLRTDQKNAHAKAGILKDLSRQILSACILCRQTYALDKDSQKSMFQPESALADYVEASAHLHTHRNSPAKTDLEIQNELLTDACLARSIEPFLRSKVMQDDSGVTGGITRFWGTARFTNDWHFVDSTWLLNHTSSKIVHYNVVSGSLLVSGRPLSQLPATYATHSLYRSIFDDLELDVFAADVDHMEYMSKDEFEGHRIYFGMRDKAVLIRVCYNEETFEALSRDCFGDDLPRAITQQTTPWMSLRDGRVVFRPRERPFCSEVWTLYPDVGPRSKSTMSAGEKSLVDGHSSVGAAICETLRPIEEGQNLIVTCTAGLIEVELPRYHLHFIIDDKGRMICRELSAFVDTDQQLGTLHGLQSRLIMRAKSEVTGANLRTVLIPNGKVEITSASPHLGLRIRLDDEDTLTLSQFKIDSRLGQLVGQDLEAHLYKAYLHAITSFPKPDLLTGRTGVEESLFALSDPICRTCLPLSARAQSILGLLSKLTPMRSFYPPHLQVMQTMTFLENVSVMTQRDIFFGTVNGILSQNMKAASLSQAEVPALTYRGDFGLLTRSHHRTCKLFPSESAASTSHAANDGRYASRDQDSGTRLRTSTTIAGLIESWPAENFSVDQNLRGLVMGWKQVDGFDRSLNFDSFATILSRNFQEIFPSLVTTCRSASTTKERLMFTLSLLAFGNPDLADTLRALFAFAIVPALQELPIPEYADYDLTHGASVSQKDIMLLISEAQKPYASPGVVTRGATRSFEEEVGEQRQLILEAVESSWPANKVKLNSGRKQLSHYKLAELKSLLNGRFAAWHKNYIFLSQLEAYDKVLGTINSSYLGPEILDSRQDFRFVEAYERPRTQFRLLDLMNVTGVCDFDFQQSEPTRLDQDLSQVFGKKEKQGLLDSNQSSRSLEELEEIVEDLIGDPIESVRSYGDSLGDSVRASRKNLSIKKSTTDIPSEASLASNLTASKEQINYLLTTTRKLLWPRQASRQGLVMARLWPEVSELALLQLLSAAHLQMVPYPWRSTLILLATEITAAQRIERLQKLLAAGDVFAVSQELSNPAHSAWATEDRPDWLLIECQNNILIRPVQIRVATELLKSQDGTVLLGMGEGKTSVILPMVATALADGNKLVRIVVLKPLAHEMLRILSQSFAGLVGRSLYYLPFSRQTNLSHQAPQRLKDLYKECRSNRGILLTLPEYLNSFRLVGLDKLAADTRHLANELISVQSWLDENSRDILDESDELCKPAYELVYTNGEQNTLSGAPDRWNIALEILDLVRRIAGSLHTNSQASFEFEQRNPGAFPHVRILDDHAAKAISEAIAEAIVDGRVPSLSLGHCDADILKAVRAFVLEINIDPSDFVLLKEHFQDSTKLDLLFVARGLIAYEILSHTLGKRWLVNYGLDRTRTLSAVPYRAKATPSSSAEFAQPDAAIVLTALSFYYTGVLPQDLERCLLLLFRLPDPDDEYVRWVKNSTLPMRYRKAASINMEDTTCMQELYSHLRWNSALCNFFLRHVVYPSEAKEFRHKLSTSAWDLCKSGKAITSGFSGTNDCKIPLAQKDLDDLRHIPAATLTTLLRFENRQYFCASSSTGGRLSTKELLERILADGPVDVCIDVGAQMLEENLEIVRLWLEMSRKEKLAAIFFSESDQKMVLNRNSVTEPLSSSIFKEELGSCIIYLDEFHTRGTDFRLPDTFEAAVLLGPGILKDNLVQACMRMRKLAVSQTVRFYAPPEVDRAIRNTMKDPSEDITSFHVVQWAIHESCLALKKQGPLYASRGLLHTRRTLAAEDYVAPDGRVVNPARYLDTIRERESRPVSELYRVGRSQRAELPFEPTREEARDEVMRSLFTEFERTNISDANGGSITQEQEREVLHEVEEEREVQVPCEAEPAIPTYCKPLLNLIQHGTKIASSTALRPCFEILTQTRLEPYYTWLEFPVNVLATPDYLRTIKTVKNGLQDDFIRPVQWVLKTFGRLQPVIISPHEAQMFMPHIRNSKNSTLYMYMARTCRDMTPFDNFDLVKIPADNNSGEIRPSYIAALNLFAGQLYFSSFERYRDFCALTGLFDGVRCLDNMRSIGNDNFVSPKCREANGWDCDFKTSPVRWIKEFINMRRLGIEWSHTHMGRVMDGHILKKEDFDQGEVGGDELVKRLTELTLSEEGKEQATSV